MHHPTLVRLSLLACTGVAALALGCGQPEPVKGVKIQGRLLENGRPVKVRPGEEIVVAFVPASPEQPGRGVSAPVNAADGRIEFYGPGAQVSGLAPGKYRVTIESINSGADAGNRFSPTFDSDRTPLTADVGEEEGQTFVIDLAKKTVTKQ
jgi:hypothetical protein